jgi:diaminopimelate decarboxylase
VSVIKIEIIATKFLTICHSLTHSLRHSTMEQIAPPSPPVSVPPPALSLFLSDKPEICREIREQFGSPVYVYSEALLQSQARAALAFPRDDIQDFRVRFAMKACPNAAILQIFNREGLNFDASSGYEVSRAMRAGISPEKISLSSQEFPKNFCELIATGIEFNACSLHQLEQFGINFPGGEWRCFLCY